MGKTVYKSEVVMNELSPKWRAMKIEASRVCNCDKRRHIFMSVYDWDKDGECRPPGTALLLAAAVAPPLPPP